MGLVNTIDGGAGTGTSSLARELAKLLGWECLNSGHLYRGITWVAKHQDVSYWQSEEIIQIAREIKFEYEHGQVVALNGHKLAENDLDDMTGLVEHYAGIPGLREIIRTEQRRYADAVDACIIEGRDLGTVVFPDAILKIYLTCDDKERARRRSNQLGEHISADMLRARDRIDAEREASPMTPAPDAIVIDTTDTDIPELVNCARILLLGKPEARQFIMSKAA